MLSFSGMVTDAQLTPILSDADREAFASLCVRVAEGNAMAFAGAGLSARVGFGDWKQLVDLLQSKSRRTEAIKVADATDLIWKADLIRESMNGRHYRETLNRHFGRQPRLDAALRALGQVPFRHLFTTNYDDSLERAITRSKRPKAWTRRWWDPTVVNWQDRERVSTLMSDFSKEDASRRYLVYLHGKHDDPRTIVLTESDYRDRYVRSDETAKRLFAVFAMRTVVFVGFSLTDLDLLMILREVRATHESPGHFAFLPQLADGTADDARLRFQTKFGVTPIFYKPGKRKRRDRHPNFAPLMQAFAERTRGENEVGNGRGGDSSRNRMPKHESMRWTRSVEFRTRRGKQDPDDPQKGRFGGRPSRDGFTLHAKAERDREEPGWYFLQLEVTPDQGKRLDGVVGFWVHDTFSSEYYSVRVHGGRASLSLRAWGAFTVGAVANDGRTPLELDLSKDRSLPKAFRDAD